jgi:hypothetical protein
MQNKNRQKRQYFRKDEFHESLFNDRPEEVGLVELVLPRAFMPGELTLREFAI